MKALNTRQIALSGVLAAFSAVTQLVHLGYQSPQWGMWIDVVAVSWFIAFFLMGFKPSLLVALISGLVITLFSPDTWLGAVMKLLATSPLLISLYLWTIIRKKNNNIYMNITSLIFPLLAGLIIRSVIIIPVNYYFAIPIWTGMTSSQAILAIPWYIIALFNTVQGILDITLAWIMVFRFRLNKFSELET